MDKNEVKLIGAILGGVLVTFIIVAMLVSIPVYYGSCKQAKVYNKIYKTDFTCADFFWASDQINSGTQTIKIK